MSELEKRIAESEKNIEEYYSLYKNCNNAYKINYLKNLILEAESLIEDCKMQTKPQEA